MLFWGAVLYGSLYVLKWSETTYDIQKLLADKSDLRRVYETNYFSVKGLFFQNLEQRREGEKERNVS